MKGEDAYGLKLVNPKDRGLHPTSASSRCPYTGAELQAREGSGKED